MRVFAIHLVLHCLAQRSWVPWQFQEDSVTGLGDVGEAAGRLQLPCPGQGVFLQKLTADLWDRGTRGVLLSSSLLSWLWVARKKSPSPWENQSAAACQWRIVCHHPSLPIKARRGQCYQSLPIQSFLVGTLLFYHFDLLPTEDKRHHGRDSWMTTVIYRPRTFWTFFPPLIHEPLFHIRKAVHKSFSTSRN